MLMVLVASSLLHYVVALGAVHNCKNSKTEPAGLSGTAIIEAGCHLKLTNITGKINVQGIRDSACEGDQQLSVNDVKYCVDANAVATVINVSGNELEVKAEQQSQSLVIQYFHGKLNWLSILLTPALYTQV